MRRPVVLGADRQAFDPLALTTRLGQLTHMRVGVNGIAVHVVCAPGAGPDPLSLLLTHGWPGLFLEYRKLLPLLTDLLAQGTASSDAFSVVVLSLPSSGFPDAGGLTHQVAELVHQHLPILIAGQ